MIETSKLEKKEKNEETHIEYTIALVKPNGVRSGLVSILRQELFDEGLEIVEEKKIVVKKEQATLMYSGLGEKAAPVVEHIISGPSHVFVLRGQGVIRKLREAIGCTPWRDRPAKGLRGKYAFNFIENTIHAPDSYRESVLEFLNLITDVLEKILTQTQLAEEFCNFLNDVEKIDKGERFINPYSI